jgi:4-amino-4-deoxy-L-arabinose transferase-like glycosyltransferase
MKKTPQPMRAESGTHASRMLPVVTIFFVAFLLRLVGAWCLPVMPLQPDSAQYRHLGIRLVERGEYGFDEHWKDDPSLRKGAHVYLVDRYGTVVTPGFPAFLGLLHKTVGDNPRTLQFIYALMCGLTAVFVYQMGLLLFGQAVAVIAALLYIFSPGDAYSLCLMAREPLQTVLVAGFAYMVLRWGKDGGLRWAVAAGLLLGVSGYVKETVALFGMAMVGILLLMNLRRGLRYVWPPLVAIFVGVAVMAPWMVRNYFCYGRPIGMSNLTGTSVWQGLVEVDYDEPPSGCDLARYLSKDDAERLDPYRAANAAEADRRIRQALAIYARDHPSKVSTAAVYNASLFWLPVSRTVLVHGIHARPQELVSLLYYLVLFPLAAAGFWVYRRLDASKLFVAALVVITFAHCPFIVSARYLVPFEPVLFPFAAAMLVAAFQHFAKRCRAGSRGEAANTNPLT